VYQSVLYALYTISYNDVHLLGCAMAQAVSRRPPIVEARVRFRVSPCGICGVQSGTGTGFSPSQFCQFHSTGAPLLGKGQKIIIIIVIFITGLHKKPQGYGASVASAAGPFTTKKYAFLSVNIIPVYHSAALNSKVEYCRPVPRSAFNYTRGIATLNAWTNLEHFIYIL
jgi:hypothetical protein